MVVAADHQGADQLLESGIREFDRAGVDGRVDAVAIGEADRQQAGGDGCIGRQLQLNHHSPYVERSGALITTSP